MSKTNKFLLLALVIALLLLGTKFIKKSDKQSAVAKSTANQPGNNLESQENEDGNVTVTVTPKVLEIGKNPVFEIEFETHSVDLSFDVSKQSVLVDDKAVSLNQSVWDGSPPGGHHRSGTLSFNNSLTQTNNVELIIKNIAGVAERKYKWNLQL